MEFTLSSYGLGYLAGLLSTLSPCVLPLLPILIGTALSAHRFGPYALAAGLSLSFTSVSLLLAVAGFSLGLDAGTLRQGTSVLLVLLGLVLISPALQQRFATLTAGIGAGGDALLSRLHIDGLRGQFGIGLMLGLIWSPCVGPTLGAAATLGAQGQHLPSIALLMLVFGLGAGTPLLVLGSLSRTLMLRTRTRLLVLGQRGKVVFGALLMVIGLITVTHSDKQFEAWVLDHYPVWLTELTTRY